MKKSPFILLSYFFILSFGQLSAQKYTVSVQQFGIEEGLAHRVVTNIYKDQNGFLWIIGYRPPMRYDGFEFRPFQLPVFTEFGEEEEGWFWFLFDSEGSTSKLTFQNPITGESQSKEERLGTTIAAQLDSLLNKEAYHFYCHRKMGKKDEWYFGGRDHLVLFDFKTGMEKIPVYPVESELIEIALIDEKNNFWVYGENGLIRKWSPNGVLLDSVKLADNILDGPFCFKSERIFEWEGHVYVRDIAGSKNQLFRLGDFGEKELVFEDPEGYCFFEFLEGQIWCLGPGGWKIFDTQGNLILELKREDYDQKLFDVLTVGSVQSDGTGKFYLNSSFGFNIIEIQKNPFIHYFSEDGETHLPINNEARGIYAENDSVLVNFENGGLVLFNKKEPADFQILYDLKKEAELGGVGNTGLPIIRDRLKNFWSKHEYHLTKWSPDLSSQQQISLSSPAQSLSIWSLWEDETGCVWYWGKLGFGKLCPDESAPPDFIGYEEAGFDYSTLYVYHILADLEGLLWICSDYGLYLFNTEQQKVVGFYHDGEAGPDYLPARIYYHMHLDRNGNRWPVTTPLR